MALNRFFLKPSSSSAFSLKWLHNLRWLWLRNFYWTSEAYRELGWTYSRYTQNPQQYISMPWTRTTTANQDFMFCRTNLCRLTETDLDDVSLKLSLERIRRAIDSNLLIRFNAWDHLHHTSAAGQFIIRWIECALTINIFAYQHEIHNKINLIK